MTELEALQKLKHGKEDALAWFIDRHTAYVGTILFHITSFVSPGKEKAYLGAIARNKGKEFLRGRKVELPLEDDVLFVFGEDPEQELVAKEFSCFVRETILSLEATDRDIFLRHYYGYQKVSAIAEEMGMNPSTVKTRLCRGRKKLKELLCKGGYRIEDADF